MRTIRTRRELTTFVAAVLIASGCSLTTSFDDLTGGEAQDSGVDAPAITDAQADAIADATPDEVTVLTDAFDAGPSYRTLVLSDMPVAYFRLGESQAPIASNEIAGGVTGKYVGTPTFGVPGAIAQDPNTAVQFTGTTPGVELGDVFDFPSGAAFTVELWVRADVIDSDYRVIFSKRTVDDAGVQGYWLYARAGLLGEPAIQFESIRSDQYHVVQSAMSLGTFHHVVVAMDAASIVLLIDGEQRSQSINPLGRIDNSTAFALASDLRGTSHHQGILDEVVIYDRVLPIARVRAHYAAGRTVADGG